jgi:2-oxoglutarate ferredoxin oxidoreductase subunit delta
VKGEGEMPKGEIVINEKLCKGCGLCVAFCPLECISMPEGKLSDKGMPLAELTDPEKCNACSVCGWMCPDFAIEVYRIKTA